MPRDGETRSLRIIIPHTALATVFIALLLLLLSFFIFISILCMCVVWQTFPAEMQHTLFPG